MSLPKVSWCMLDWLWVSDDELIHEIDNIR